MQNRMGPPGIDGDILVYRAGFAVEKTQYMLNTDDKPCFSSKKEMLARCEELGITEPRYESWKVVQPESHALHALRELVDKILRNTCSTEYVMYLTGDENFREDVASIRKYKGNRKAPKPKHYDALRRYLTERYRAVTSVGMEADDLLAMHNGLKCSADKDLLQVPGRHYNFIKDEFYDITEEDGDYNLFIQILVGDTVDNIQGCPGIGIKKAQGLLAECYGQPKAMYDVALEQYRERWPEEHQLTPEQALHETAELVYLLRYPEDSWQRKFKNLYGETTGPLSSTA